MCALHKGRLAPAKMKINGRPMAVFIPDLPPESGQIKCYVPNPEDTNTVVERYLSFALSNT